MSWLSQTWKHNRGWAGNALKNFAPVAGAVFGGPLGGGLIGGLGSMVGRGIQKGANFGNVLKQGASGASIAAGGHSALKGLRGLFTPSSSVAQSIAPDMGMEPGQRIADIGGGGGAAPTLQPITAGRGGVPDAIGPYRGYLPPPATGAEPSLLSRVGGKISGAAHWADEHPMAAAMGLQGVGNIADAGAENDMHRAQTRAIESETAAAEEERKRRQRMEEALEPLRQALVGQLSRGGAVIPPNPYYS